MNDEYFSLTTKINNLDKLPLETLIKLKQLYEDNHLPKNIRESIEKEGFYCEKLSELIAQAEYEYQVSSSEHFTRLNLLFLSNFFS